MSKEVSERTRKLVSMARNQSAMSIYPPVTNSESSGHSRDPTYSPENVQFSEVGCDSLGDSSITNDELDIQNMDVITIFEDGQQQQCYQELVCVEENFNSNFSASGIDNATINIEVCEITSIDNASFTTGQIHDNQQICVVPTENNENRIEIAEEHLNEVEDRDVQTQDKGVTKKGKERKRKGYQVSLQERKKQKMLEKKEKFSVKPPCGDKCIKKCKTNIAEERRKEINKIFWDRNWTEQRQFILSHTQRENPKRKKAPGSGRKFSYEYYLKSDEGVSIQVCKVFFLTTLGYKPSNDKVVYNALSTSIDHVRYKPDMRGKAPCKHRIDNDQVKAHIESFNPSISHYRREHAPRRRYLPNDVTVSFMYEDFKQKHKGKKISYDYYRRCLTKMNIAFTKLGHEECELCATLENHDHSKDNLNPTCKTCKIYYNHMLNVYRSRAEYRQDAQSEKEQNELCFSADLQKVIMLPRMEQYKLALFTPRIVVFNESFVPVGKKQSHIEPLAVVWHEGIAGRKKEDIISSFYAFFLAYRDAEKITLWLDNCSGQNKNWCLLNFLLYIINSEDIATREIQIKYFEPGHSFMSADCFHHQVELSMKHKKYIYDFSDFTDSVRSSNSGHVRVKEMTIGDFYYWKDHTSQTKLKKLIPRVYLNAISKIVATRGKTTLLVYQAKDANIFDNPNINFEAISNDLENNSNLSEPVELNFLIARFAKNGIKSLPEPQTQNRGVDQGKINTILAKLCPLMPNNRRKFWEEFPVGNAEEDDED